MPQAMLHVGAVDRVAIAQIRGLRRQGSYAFRDILISIAVSFAVTS